MNSYETIKNQILNKIPSVAIKRNVEPGLNAFLKYAVHRSVISVLEEVNNYFLGVVVCFKYPRHHPGAMCHNLIVTFHTFPFTVVQSV